jgi:hypothetical protein
MITKYNQYNESLRDKMKGKSNNELKSIIFNNSFIIKKGQYCDWIEKEIDRILDIYNIDVNDTVIIDNESNNAEDLFDYMYSLVEHPDDIEEYVDSDKEMKYTYYIKDKILHGIDDYGELEFIVFDINEIKRKLNN